MSLKSWFIRLDVEHYPILNDHLPGVVVDHIGGNLLPCPELVQAHFLVGIELADGFFHVWGS
jgi:hypothetical protein